MFKSPIEHLKDFIKQLVGDFANAAFDWIELFMLNPTDFTEYERIDHLYSFFFDLSAALCVVFVTWSLVIVLIQQMSGNETRSIGEVVMRGGTMLVLAASAPWLLDKGLMTLNNAIVQYFLDEGLDTETLEEFVVKPLTASITIHVMSLVIVFLFMVLAFQYIRRIGEYIVLLATAPIAALSIITDNFEVFSVWWREAISVIFSQAFQVAFLWLILNMITGTESVKDYIMAIGLMVVILAGPKYLRQFLYSSGAGRSVVGGAGGAGKMAMYKYAASKITKRAA